VAVISIGNDSPQPLFLRPFNKKTCMSRLWIRTSVLITGVAEEAGATGGFYELIDPVHISTRSL
jgi:hypothetical protein